MICITDAKLLKLPNPESTLTVGSVFGPDGDGRALLVIEVQDGWKREVAGIERVPGR